jgi:hypothetical protein
MLELCSTSYFRLSGCGLWATSCFGKQTNAARRVVVVNQALCARTLKANRQLGAIQFDVLDELPGTPRDAYFEIVGVVSDSKMVACLMPMPEAFALHHIHIGGSDSGQDDRGSQIATDQRAAGDLERGLKCGSSEVDR